MTGKHGQLGQSLQKWVNASPSADDAHREIRPKAHDQFTFVGRDELDLASPQSIANYFTEHAFDAVINFAAYTAVDQAESEPELANQINHLAVAQLAEIVKQQSIPLIHISTDYVFNGQGVKPYVETDPTDPQNVYGLTKRKGEEAILASGCSGAIIRTSWLYSAFGRNFVKTMLRLGKQRERLNVVIDQVGSPTYAMDLAQAVLVVLNSEFPMLNEQQMPEIQHSKLNIYHFSNEGACSWYDFAKAIFELSEIACKVYPIETKDYPTRAKRPYYSVMNKTKIKQAGLVIPHWRDSLKEMLS